MFTQLLINSIIAGSTYTLVALSFSLIYSTTKFSHFAHGTVYTFCPYFAYLFTVILQIPIFISIPLAIISSATVGILKNKNLLASEEVNKVFLGVLIN